MQYRESHSMNEGTLLSTAGQQEVIEGLPTPEPRSNIDQMIEALANRQYRNEQQPSAANQQPAPSAVRHVTSPRSGLYHHRHYHSVGF